MLSDADTTDERLTFAQCLAVSLDQPELIKQFDRLTGANLSMKGSPLDVMIDKSTGRTVGNFVGFVAFVKECIWDRLPPEIRRGEWDDD